MHLDAFHVGSTLNFTTSVPEYPANDGWTLKYRLVPRVSGTAIVLTGSSDDSTPELHRIEAAAATTATWAAGAYSWASWVEKGGEIYDLSHGSVTLLPDPRVATAPLDLRTDAEKALAAAEAALASWTPTMRSYTIGGRSMTFQATAEIVPIVSYWKLQVQRERRAEALRKGLPDPRKVFVRLGRV